MSMCLFHQKGLVLLMWVNEISFGHFVLCFQVLQETHVASPCNLYLFFIGLKYSPYIIMKEARLRYFIMVSCLFLVIIIRSLASLDY